MNCSEAVQVQLKTESPISI